MKNKSQILNLLILLLLIFIVSCKDNRSGYSCVDNECVADFDDPQYLTLSDCQRVCGCTDFESGYNCVNGNCIETSSNAEYATLSDCENNCSMSKGYAKINVNWSDYNPQSLQSIKVGIGYSSVDVSNDAYFKEHSFSYPDQITLSLDPQIYYYKANKTIIQWGNTVIEASKSGSFTVTSSSYTTVNISFTE